MHCGQAFGYIYSLRRQVTSFVLFEIVASCFLAVKAGATFPANGCQFYVGEIVTPQAQAGVNSVTKRNM